MKNNIFSNIIGGKFKGQKIALPPLSTTRSTKSIIKESLFNMIAFDIEGVEFVEVFGGSGSIVLEAISRGAKQGYAIECDKNAYKILNENCQKIAPDAIKTFFGDTFEITPRIIKDLKNPSILYLDPPFFFRQNCEQMYQKCFDLVQNIKNDNVFLVVFELESSFKLPQNLGQYLFFKSKKFGKSTLSYYKI